MIRYTAFRSLCGISTFASPTVSATKRYTCLGPPGFCSLGKYEPLNRMDEDDICGVSYCPGPMVWRVMTISRPTLIETCFPSSAVLEIAVPRQNVVHLQNE